MRIAVCLKRVPDTEMRFAIAPDGKSVDPTGLKYEISTFDEYAVEVALRLNEAHGPGETTVIGIGPGDVHQTPIAQAAASSQLRPLAPWARHGTFRRPPHRRAQPRGSRARGSAGT